MKILIDCGASNGSAIRELENKYGIFDKIYAIEPNPENARQINTKDSKIVLDRIAKILAERKDIYFTIEGHVCCTQGERDAMDRKTKKRNLSVARAKYVYDYLAKNGVHRSRMKYVGHRRKLPLGGDPELDRRVEILVTRITED